MSLESSYGTSVGRKIIACMSIQKDGGEVGECEKAYCGDTITVEYRVEVK